MFVGSMSGYALLCEYKSKSISGSTSITSIMSGFPCTFEALFAYLPMHGLFDYSHQIREDWRSTMNMSDVV